MYKNKLEVLLIWECLRPNQKCSHLGMYIKPNKIYYYVSSFEIVWECLLETCHRMKGLSNHATFRCVVIVVVFHFIRYWFEALAGTLVILTLLLVRKKTCLIFSMLNGRVWVPFQVCPNEDWISDKARTRQGEDHDSIPSIMEETSEAIGTQSIRRAKLIYKVKKTSKFRCWEKRDKCEWSKSNWVRVLCIVVNFGWFQIKQTIMAKMGCSCTICTTLSYFSFTSHFTH